MNSATSSDKKSPDAYAENWIPAVSVYPLQRAELSEDGLVFDMPGGFARAISDGFFLVRQPSSLDITSGDIFARHFYHGRLGDDSYEDIYRGFQAYTSEPLGSKNEGYYLRKQDQTEQFFLEKKFWKSVYPPDVTALAIQLDDLAVKILRAVLREIGLPENIWERVTGGATSGAGTHHLTFNHFRSGMRARGLNIHKDSGWVTVLRSIERGLEAFIRNEWYVIDPVPGYFIINFGCAMEILTRRLAMPVSAIVHRVVEQKKQIAQLDRFSYALFIDNSLDEQTCPGLYGYDPASGLFVDRHFGDFLNSILDNTYRADSVGLYDADNKTQ